MPKVPSDGTMLNSPVSVFSGVKQSPYKIWYRSASFCGNFMRWFCNLSVDKLLQYLQGKDVYTKIKHKLCLRENLISIKDGSRGCLEKTTPVKRWTIYQRWSCSTCYSTSSTNDFVLFPVSNLVKSWPDKWVTLDYEIELLLKSGLWYRSRIPSNFGWWSRSPKLLDVKDGTKTILIRSRILNFRFRFLYARLKQVISLLSEWKLNAQGLLQAFEESADWTLFSQLAMIRHCA